jgi:glycosyltransferase involved in cell wall biosynthesis
MIYALERPRIVRFEQQVADLFEETWLIAEPDRQVLAALCPQANIQVVPNGVDIETFRPLDTLPEPDSLIFVGHMGVFHNVDAAVYLTEDILPRVQQSLPNCRLTIVGAEPAPQVQQLAQNPAVTVTGFVPDLNAYLSQAAVFVAPLRFAAGVQNKVLEAMAAGKPVVTTPLVNAGIGAEPDRDLIITDGAEEMARQIVRLLANSDLCRGIGTAARSYVRQNFSWNHAVRRMDEIEALLNK